jgi:hypothetical protein
MPLGSAAIAWLGMVGFGGAMLLIAIQAGRSTHGWQRVPLLFLELVFGGGALLSWMAQVWFVAKILMTTGMGPSAALLLGIACGIVLLLLAAAVCVLIVRAGYSVLGRRDRFRSDFANSLWISRSHTFRPNDF